jgi:hypothetical protein
MRTDLFTHPKVVRIASALNADTLRTIGGLMSTWCLFDAHSIDGTLHGYTAQSLDHHLRWDGFAVAMIAVGWLIESGESLALPDFDTHNGACAKRRVLDAERKRIVRKTSALNEDKPRTREDKKREEKNKDNKDDIAASGTSKRTRISKTFSLTKERQDAAHQYWKENNRQDLSAIQEFEKFVNHHTATGKPMMSWDAAWRTWYANSISFTKPPSGAKVVRMNNGLPSAWENSNDKTWAAGLIPGITNSDARGT